MQTPGVLNCLTKYADRVDPNPAAVVDGLKGRLDALVDRFRDSQTGLVDYQGLRETDDFLSFEVATSELQSVRLGSMSDSLKKAFCINLYNLAISHAFCKVGIPTDKENRGPFFTGVGYQLGEGFFSFDHIENGVLRANRNGILGGAGGAAEDPRRDVIFPDDKVDCRIHFALNCGAASCPPIKRFTAASIDEELDCVARAYCEDPSNVQVDADAGVCRLNMIFNWYGKDFGSTDREKVAKVMEWCDGEKKESIERLLNDNERGCKVEYLPYDWGSDSASPVRRFDISNVFKDGDEYNYDAANPALIK